MAINAKIKYATKVQEFPTPARNKTQPDIRECIRQRAFHYKALSHIHYQLNGPASPPPNFISRAHNPL